MAYIPPHRRLSADAPGADTAIASPPASPSPPSHNLKLDYSPFAVKTFLVISESSSRLLEFMPFEGKLAFSHLEGSSLYAIKRDQSSAAHEEEGARSDSHNDQLLDLNSEERAESCTSSGLVIHEEGKEYAICHSIVEGLRDDLASVIEELRKSMHSQDSVNRNPKILLSVGRILLSSIDGRSFDWDQRYTPQFLEQQFQMGGKRKAILKTFYDPQPSDLFKFFKETAEKDNLQTRTKKRYFIVVADKERSGTVFFCVCYLAADYTTTFQENTIGLQRLEIRKVKRATRLRHMVADIACIDKSHDLRLQLYTDEKSLSAEERADLESLMCHVLFVDGHPFLRYGGLCSSSGRFQFDHMFLSKTYSFKGATFKWRLESVPGMCYVRIKPILVQDYLQGHVECTADELMQSIEETLVRLWKCC